MLEAPPCSSTREDKALEPKWLQKPAIQRELPFHDPIERLALTLVWLRLHDLIVRLALTLVWLRLDDLIVRLALSLAWLRHVQRCY